VPFGQDKPGMSQSPYELIGATTHHGPQPQPPLMYGTPQYPPAYGGTSYYPPPPYQQPYPIAIPPPISGPPPAPPIHPPSQTNLEGSHWWISFIEEQFKVCNSKRRIEE
jgi:hypothetical protein